MAQRPPRPARGEPTRRSRPASPKPARAAAIAIALLLGTAAATAEPAAADATPPRLPNLVLITIDTLRADHLGSYGYFRDTSPAIDAVAADALRVERAFAPMPTTLPSHVSLLTSSLPARHGVLSNFRYLQIPFAASDGLQSVAQRLAAHGYATSAFTSASPLARGTGIETGFAHFDAPASFAEADESVRRIAGETVDLAIAWLESAPSPFFLWVHVFDPHLPYEAPAPYGDAFGAGAGAEPDPALDALLEARGIPDVLRRHAARSVDAYDGEIRYTDAQIGRLLGALRRLDLYEGSVLVITGDHGEGLLQHGEPGHESVFGSSTRVPLILRWPGGPRGERSERIASLVDVLPTLRAHTALPLRNARFDGVDLLARGSGEALAQEPVQTSTPRERTFALTTDDWKYWHLVDAPDRLYDLRRDPGETTDVIAEHPDVAARLRARIDALLAEARSKPGVEVSDDIDPAQRERLRKLGYAD